MIIVRQSPSCSDGTINVGSTVPVAIHQLGQLRTLHDPDILADGINVNPENFMKPIGKKLPILTLQSPNLSLTSRNEEGT